MPARPRILIIDDSPLVLELTSAALRDSGYDVDVASDLTSFEARREEAAHDLIVIDVQMPEAFGDDVASTLRGAYRVEVPILLLSSLPDADLAVRADRADVGWISKNAGMTALVERVERTLRQHGGA